MKGFQDIGYKGGNQRVSSFAWGDHANHIHVTRLDKGTWNPFK